MKKALKLFLACSAVISTSSSLMGMNNNNNEDPTNNGSQRLSSDIITPQNNNTNTVDPHQRYFAFFYINREILISIPGLTKAFAVGASTTERLTQEYKRPENDFLRYFLGININVKCGTIFLIGTQNDENYSRELDSIWEGAPSKENLFLFDDTAIVRAGVTNKSRIKLIYRFKQGCYCDCIYIPQQYVNETRQRIRDYHQAGYDRVQEKISKWKAKKQLESQQISDQPNPNQEANEQKFEPTRNFINIPKQMPFVQEGYPTQPPFLKSSAQINFPKLASSIQRQPQQPIFDNKSAELFRSSSSLLPQNNSFQITPNFSLQPGLVPQINLPNQSTFSNQFTVSDFPSPEPMQKSGYLPCLYQEPLYWLTKSIFYRLNGNWRVMSGYNKIVAWVLNDGGFRLPSVEYTPQNLLDEVKIMSGLISGTNTSMSKLSILLVRQYLALFSTLLVRQYLALFSTRAENLVSQWSQKVKELGVESDEQDVQEFTKELKQHRVRIAELLTSHASKAQQLSDMKQGLNHGMELMFQLLSIATNL